MAGKDVDDIVVGANGTVWVAPIGTVAPVDETVAPGVAWLDLGYLSEDGVTLQDSKSLEMIPVWQSFYPARRIVTERDLMVNFSLRQWGKDQVKLAFGGGTITTPAAGKFKYVPPAPENLVERALMVDWVDGVKKYRLIMSRGMVTEGVESQLVRSAAADLPISFGIIGDDTGQPWYLLTNDATFA